MQEIIKVAEQIEYVQMLIDDIEYVGAETARIPELLADLAELRAKMARLIPSAD